METKNSDLSSLRINRTEKTEPGKSKRNITVITTIIIVLAACIFGYNLVSSALNSAIEVKLTTATLQTPAQSSAIFTASGYVVAQRKAAVASKGTGRLVYLGVVEGDKVRKDQIIARLEDSDVRAQLDEAKANLELQESSLKDAGNNYERQKALLKTGSASQSSVDAAESNYKHVLASINVAKAQVQAAEVALENTIIRAPFTGTVLTKDADVGEIVAPLAAGVNSKAAVVTIADMSSLQVEANVSESNIEKISFEQESEIILDAYPGQSYAGYVAKVVPTADRTKATVLVKVGFKNYDARVLPEMSAKVMFLSKDSNKPAMGQQPLLVVPSTAIINRNGKHVVFIVKNNEAVQVQVTTGQQFDSFIEIKSGLKNGDQIIDNITDKIKDGTKVKAS
ncbi:MAG: efflux RND transporter periplasmic adaptor subunit [Ignavibacteriaceae bacterium]|nr:efflux RND transporter periplasmic adaptor subunit [Ignavibacteriaceae bacterium]